jgi:hypothetical protein
MMTGIKFVILLLAAWRITAFLAYERWTETLRTRLGVDMVDDEDVPISFCGKVFGCFWCLSLVAALLCCLLALVDMWVVLTLLACSGGVILLNHVSRVFRYAED